MRRSALVLMTLAVTTAACGLVLGLPDQPLLGTDIADGGHPDGFHPGDSTFTDSQLDTNSNSDVVADSGCSSDLTTDKLNCGKCGHDCLGGACLASVCQATALVKNKLGLDPRQIAVDDAGIYVVANGSTDIDKIDLVDSGISFVAKGETSLRGMALANGSVYFTNYSSSVGGVSRCSNMGCGVSRKDFVTNNTHYPFGIAVDSSGIYFTLADYFANGGGLQKCSLPDCAGGPKEVLKFDQPGDLATDSTSLHWIDYGGGGPYSCPKSGCVDGGAPSGTQATAFTQDATNVYWVTSASIWVRPKSGGFASKLVANLNTGSDLAVDANYVYWLEEGTPSTFTDGTLKRCPLTKDCVGNPALIETLATALSNAWSITQTDTLIYFTTRGDDGVWRAVK